MKTLQLYREGKQLLGSDGIMKVDGRVNISNTKVAVRQRNASFAKNFPHKVADSFALYEGGQIGGKLSILFTLD